MSDHNHNHEEKIKHRHSHHAETANSIDWDCLVRDVLRQWLFILMAGISAALLIGAVMQFRYKPVYSTTTTFVIGKNGFSNNMIYENLNSAEEITKLYQHIVDSTVLKKSVCDDLGLSALNATTDVSTVTNSNLMNLKVTADSPKLAYEISSAINRNATQLMAELGDDVMIHVLTEPSVPTKVSNPLDTSRYMKYGAAVGAGLALLIFAYISYIKDTIKNRKDIEKKLDTKLVGTIYHEKKRKARHQLMKKKKKVSLLLDQPLLSFRYVESCRLLASRVALSMKRENAKTLMITSVSENEGKSTIAANVSLALAQEGYKVFLVDCDFRKPSQYKIFEVDKNEAQGKDFTATIADKSEIRFMRYKGSSNLNLLLSIAPKRKPWSKDSMEHLRKVIMTLRKYSDFVILDTSPMAMVADAEEYATIADASMLVVMQDVMEAGYINDAIDSLRHTGTKILGCVFNNVKSGLGERMGSYGHYGSGYGYYGYGKQSDKKSGK